MRLYAALCLPGSISGAIEPPAADGMRAIPKDRWHITLAFYGECDERNLECLQHRLAARLAGLGRPIVRIIGGGSFPGIAYLSVAGASEPDNERLHQLALVCQRTGGACGTPGTRGRQRFRAHVTVGRMRGGAPVDALLLERLNDTRSPQWPVDRVELVQSVLGPRPVYTTLDTFPLV